MPTPLDNIPTYPDYLKPIVSVFWDVLYFKTVHAEYAPLSLIKEYMELFEVQIHPTVIRIIYAIDKSYTQAINKAIQERSSNGN